MEEPPEGENWIKQFLRVFKHASSPGSDEGVHHRVGYFGSYRLASEDLEGEVFDWVMHYLEQKKCPHSLAVVLSKALVEEVHCKADFSDLQTDDDCTASLECGKNLIDAGQLKSQVFNFLTELIQYWKDHYEQVASTTIWPRPPIHEVSVCAIKNARRKMEDRHMVLHDLNVACDLQNLPRHSYYAIFDGHAGTEAASFSAAHLHWEIVRHPAFLSDMPTAIKEAFKTTDRRLLERSFREGIKSGCTVVCCIIREKTLYLAWLGDSQAMVVRQGVPLSVTSPHKPDREDERQRIENAGGCILFIGTWRVNGTLAVSRALGDPEHKPYVSSVPDVIAVNLDGTEDFLILGCDGLWDRMTPSDVITSVFFYIKENPNDAENASSSLVHEAKDKGSNDNITAIVVFLRDPADLVNSPVPVPVIFPQLQGEPKIVYGSQVFGSDATLSRCGPDDMKKLKSQNESQQSGIPLTNPIGTNRHGEIYRPFTMDVILERTELSELPTPPIDEIMNTKQFETYSQNLNETNMGVHHLNTSSLIQEQNILEHEPKAKTFYAKLPVGHAKIEKISTELVNSAIESAIQIVKNKEKDIITQLQNLQETETVKSVLLQEYINTEDSAICELDKFGLEQQKVQVEQTETCNALITSEIKELSLAFKSFKEKSVYTSRPGLESIGLAPTSQTETEHLLVTQGLITQVLPTLKPETKQQVFAQKDSLTQQTPDLSSKMEQLIFNVHDESAQPIAVPTRYQCDDLNTERTPSKTKQPTMLHGESTEPITSTSLETEYYQQSNLKQATAPPSETGLVAFLSCETESEQELVPPSETGQPMRDESAEQEPAPASETGQPMRDESAEQEPAPASETGQPMRDESAEQEPAPASETGQPMRDESAEQEPVPPLETGLVASLSCESEQEPVPPLETGLVASLSCETEQEPVPPLETGLVASLSCESESEQEPVPPLETGQPMRDESAEQEPVPPLETGQPMRDESAEQEPVPPSETGLVASLSCETESEIKQTVSILELKTDPLLQPLYLMQSERRRSSLNSKHALGESPARLFPELESFTLDVLPKHILIQQTEPEQLTLTPDPNVSDLNFQHAASSSPDKMIAIHTDLEECKRISSVYPELEQLKQQITEVTPCKYSSRLTPYESEISTMQLESEVPNVKREKLSALSAQHKVTSEVESIQTLDSCQLGALEKPLLPFGELHMASATNEVMELPKESSVDKSEVGTTVIEVGTIPDTVPEAEGIIEDIDSDSEKDGGWKYVKGEEKSKLIASPKTKKSEQITLNKPIISSKATHKTGTKPTKAAKQIKIKSSNEKSKVVSALKPEKMKDIQQDKPKLFKKAVSNLRPPLTKEKTPSPTNVTPKPTCTPVFKKPAVPNTTTVSSIKKTFSSTSKLGTKSFSSESTTVRKQLATQRATPTQFPTPVTAPKELSAVPRMLKQKTSTLPSSTKFKSEVVVKNSEDAKCSSHNSSKARPTPGRSQTKCVLKPSNFVTTKPESVKDKPVNETTTCKEQRDVGFKKTRPTSVLPPKVSRRSKQIKESDKDISTDSSIRQQTSTKHVGERLKIAPSSASSQRLKTTPQVKSNSFAHTSRERRVKKMEAVAKETSVEKKQRQESIKLMEKMQLGTLSSSDKEKGSLEEHTKEICPDKAEVIKHPSLLHAGDSLAPTQEVSTIHEKTDPEHKEPQHKEESTEI